MIIYRCPFSDSLRCPRVTRYHDDARVIDLSDCCGPLMFKDEDGDDRALCTLNIKDPVEAHIDVFNKLIEKIYFRKVKDDGEA